MASSTEKKTYASPLETGRITDFFTPFRVTTGSEVTPRTSGVEPQKLKRLRKAGGVDKSKKKHNSGSSEVTVNTTSSCSEEIIYRPKPSTEKYVDFVSCDAGPPVTREPSLSTEVKNLRKCHLQNSHSSQVLGSSSSSGESKDRQCTKNIYSKPIPAKRMPESLLPQTLGWRKINWPVEVETTDDGPLSDPCQGKQKQHLSHLFGPGVKSTQNQSYTSCCQGITLLHKEQVDEAHIPRRNHRPKKAEKLDPHAVDSVDPLPALSALQPGGHVLQKSHDNLLWSLPWPTSPLLKNLRGSFPVCSSSKPYHPPCDSITTPSTPQMDRQRRSGWRENLSEDILKHLLEEMKVANPPFPVQRFFTALSRKRLEHEKALANQEGSTCNPRVPDDHCLRGKRKWRLEGLTQGISPKRRRPNQRPEEKAAVEPGSPAGPSPASSGRTPSRLGRLSRLSRTRRRRQQQESASPSVASNVTLNLRENAGNDIENTAKKCHDQEGLWDDVLWTEKYQPQHSTEVVGNPAGVKKLHNWLKEWKLRADKEEWRRRKEEMRRGKSKESWDSGDFEGEVVFEDCEPELCTALLITGPHGIGKTAAVYACAQELGFKVFEVNASSQRSGHLLLTQLKEATQSHQVRTSSSTTAATLKPTYFTSRSTAVRSAKPVTSPRKANSSRKVMTSSRRLPSTLRKSSLRRGHSASVDLTHFFQRRSKPESTNQSCPNHIEHGAHTVEPNSEKSEEKSCPDKQEGDDDDDDDNHSMTRTGKSTLMSLILFEEVDVIFSEDVGFLSAIKTFMSTTKRPVVLTTTDPLFGETFDGHLKELHFKKPSVKVVCSYLQLVCLVEKVRTDPRDMSSLPAAQKGDIRQCLLQLQFWVGSGGGAAAAPPALSHPVPTRGLPCVRRTSAQAQEESAERSKQPTDLPACDADCSGTPREFLDTGAVHELARMFKVHTWTPSENSRCSEVLSESQRRGVDLLYLNMEALLPLPPIVSPEPGDYLKEASNSALHGDIKAKELPEPSAVVKPLVGRLASKQRKRRCLSLKGMQRSKPNSPEKTEERRHHTDQSEGRTVRLSAEKKASSSVSRCLDSLTGFLDDLSFLDCFLQDGHVKKTGHCTPGLRLVRTRAEVKDGMLDQPREEQQEEEKEQTWGRGASDMRAAVEGMSFRRCCLEMEQSMARLHELGKEMRADQWKQVLEQLTLPPPPHRDGLLSSQTSHSETTVVERRADIIKTVLASKAFSRLGGIPAVITDYLPCLRTICKSESLQDKAKHRFPHYLKSIHTGLSKGTLQQLSTDFP